MVNIQTLTTLHKADTHYYTPIKVKSKQREEKRLRTPKS